uniref:Alkaline protease n=1 Tax=Oceanobacillus iheyensis TaxID=182710 RepID=E3UEQ6_9BACI|nr:alkaline protease [Oceanobacillus iheyensis]
MNPGSAWRSPVVPFSSLGMSPAYGTQLADDRRHPHRRGVILYVLGWAVSGRPVGNPQASVKNTAPTDRLATATLKVSKLPAFHVRPIDLEDPARALAPASTSSDTGINIYTASGGSTAKDGELRHSHSPLVVSRR